MADTKQNAMFAGARLVWQHQPVLWWIYAANLALAFTATRDRVAHAGEALDHSLAAAHLVKGFDLGALIELAAQPERYLGRPPASVLFNSVLFAVVLLFLTGGVLATYGRDEDVPAGEFFRSCGAFFWRLARLAIVFILLLIPFATLAGFMQAGANSIGDRSVGEQPGFWAGIACAAILLFLLLVLRLWLDMAEVIAVAENDTKTPRTLAAAARLTRRNFGSLFWLFLRISLVAWAGLALGIWVWIRLVQPEAIGAAFFVSQVILLFLVATRLWQRASEMQWYRTHVPRASLPSEPPPIPADTAQPEPSEA